MDTMSEKQLKMKAKMAHARKHRPIKPDNLKVKTISVSLRIEEIELLKQLGNGKLTSGIRNLLKNIINETETAESEENNTTPNLQNDIDSLL